MKPAFVRVFYLKVFNMALSTEGISHQIVSSIQTYRVDKLGTENDCKVVLNHLVRKFSEPLEKEGKQKKYYSQLVDANSSVRKEHLIPVKEIMRNLLALNGISDRYALAKQIHSYLVEALIIVFITDEEDAKLNACGYQQAMPKEYFDKTSPLFNDVWSRYKRSGIYLNIIDAS